MEAIQDYFGNFFRLIKTIEITDVLDIILVTVLIYYLIRLVRTTNTGRIIRLVVAFLLLSLVTKVAELHVLNFLMSWVLELGIIVVVVLFQPELRRALDRLVSANIRQLFTAKGQNRELDHMISQTVMACEALSRDKVGALIVFERTSPMDEYFKTGTIVDGKLSEQLLRNLFFPNASLHDGAMVVRGDRIHAAGCVLPLSQNHHISADLGTRHRAGLGLSELTDAVVVIVSEETGVISVAVNGMLKRHLAPETLGKLLQNELNPAGDTEKAGFKLPWRAKRGGKEEKHEER